MKKYFFSLVLLAMSTITFTSCTKEAGSEGNAPSGAPQSQIPAPFAGNWSSTSVGLTTYWNQGSYDKSYGNTVFSTVLNGNGTSAQYGYYEGAYSSIFFYKYNCTATYKLESDGTVTITQFPYGGEQIIGTGPKKPIGSSSLYPNRKFIYKNCEVITQNGKTYLTYYSVDDNGDMSSTPSHLQKID